VTASRPQQPPRAPTIIDVAHRAKVSKSTVSNVLQGKVRVDDATRERVLGAMSELGYRTNAGARSLRQRSQVLGVVVGDLRNPFHAEMAALIEGHAAANRHSILLATTGGVADKETARVQTLLEHRVAAIIFVAFSGSAAVLETIPAGVPRIFVSFAARGGLSIAVDDRKGARLAVEHLLDLGHRRVGYVSTTLEDEPQTDAARFAAFRRTMQSRGVPVDGGLVARRLRGGGADRPSVGDELAGLLSRRRRPTAIFAASDFSAVEVMEAADAVGLEIPSDLSVVGFDDIAIAGLARIGLTTVAQPMDDMARRAVLLGIEAASSVDEAGPKAVRLPPRLVVRSSTGPVRRVGAR
jgi:LacI family transcriptional regulator, galactose operon repressor